MYKKLIETPRLNLSQESQSQESSRLDYLRYLQGWAKEWALGCVNSPPLARESQEAGVTQPRAHSFAQPCT